MGADVLVAANGRLGVRVSSARFKRDIRDMGEASSGLLKLRPVTFRYKDDQGGTRQYGLVAEEVAKIYPELVTYDADGKILTVRYSELSSMLLNELHNQASELRQQTNADRRQAEQMKRQAREIKRQAKLIKALSAQLVATQGQLGALRTGVAQRLSSLEQSVAANNSRAQAGGGFRKSRYESAVARCGYRDRGQWE
jgi:Chaperone of endosialidase